MSDISPCSATLANGPVSDGVPARATTSDAFGAQLKDALQAGQPTSAPPATTEPQTPSSSKPSEPASSVTKPTKTPSSSLLNHSQRQSASSAKQPGTANTTSMKSPDPLSADGEPASAQASSAGIEPEAQGMGHGNARDRIAAVPEAAALPQISVASSAAKAVTTNALQSASKARRTNAESRHGDDDKAMRTDHETGAAVIPPPAQGIQPPPAERGAPVSGATDPGPGGKTVNAGSKVAHGAASHATQETSGTTDQAGAQQAAPTVQTAAGPSPDQPQAQVLLQAGQAPPAAFPHAAAQASAAASLSPGDDVIGASGTGSTPQIAGQVTGPMVTLLRSADGASSMAVSLHPKELGEVKIRLDRDAGGAVRVVVAATDPGTLRSLIADQSHLHAALDAASLPAVDRQVSFELVGGQAGGGGAGNQGAQPGSGDSGQRGGQARQQNWGSGDAGTEEPSAALAFPIASRPGLYRSGINITA